MDYQSLWCFVKKQGSRVDPVATSVVGVRTNQWQKQTNRQILYLLAFKINLELTQRVLPRLELTPHSEPIPTFRSDSSHEQASTGRRRPRRPGLPNSLFPSWDSYFAEPATKAMDENWDVFNDFRGGNKGFKDPGWRERRRLEDP